MRKTLLLNSTYEVLSFIEPQKAIKLLLKEKVEVLAVWTPSEYERKEFKHPAVLRLLKYAPRKFIAGNFTRQSVVKRDKSKCQYCGLKLLPIDITIDHVFPKSLGGQLTFTNCVVACRKCNNKKANRTPKQAGMHLLRTPINPAYIGITYNIYQPDDHWHEEWGNYLM